MNCEKVGNEGKKVALLLGKGVDEVSGRVLAEVGPCILYWLGKWWQKEGVIIAYK